MKTYKGIGIFFIFLIIVSGVFASSDQAINYTSQASDKSSSAANTLANFKIESIRQDPYPVNPNELVDIYIKLKNIGGEVINPGFKFILPYPLSLYPETDSDKLLGEIGAGEKVNLNYKIKVDKEALPGEYEAELRAYIKPEVYYTYFFKIKVYDVTSDFDLALQEVTPLGASLVLSNIGKNTASAITIKLNDQTDFDILGPRSIILGNLNNGDYTLINALVKPKKGSKNPVLDIEIDYTDSIGNRRILKKQLPVTLTPQISNGFDQISGGSMNSTTNRFNRGATPQTDNTFKYTTGALVLALIIAIIHYKRKLRKNSKDEE